MANRTVTHNGLSYELRSVKATIADKLTPIGFNPAGAFRFRFESETGGRYWIETSTNLTEWSSLLLLTNLGGTSVVTDVGAAQFPLKYYRARQQ